MTRLENVCNFVKGEVERKRNVKIDIIRGMNTISVEVLYPYHETVYRFDVDIPLIESLAPDGVVELIIVNIIREWLRRIERDI